MLYILTGDSQTGKTRWLERIIQSAEKCGFEVHGILTPGVWEIVDGAYVKRGIDIVLFPQETRMLFAVPQYDETTQLGWTIQDDALQAANAHLADFLQYQNSEVSSDNSASNKANKLLIIDEIGPLEFIHHAGFVNAMQLLDMGYAAGFEHAIIIVRPSLVEQARQQFSHPWENDIEVVTPQSDIPLPFSF